MTSTVIKPWGMYETLSSEQGWLFKKIIVSPQQKLSLQSHMHRSEHWIVIEGNGLVTIGNDIVAVSENSHVFIPKETKHRIHNTTDVPLVFLEVQIGALISEEDIIRHEDEYGRAIS